MEGLLQNSVEYLAPPLTALYRFLPSVFQLHSLEAAHSLQGGRPVFGYSHPFYVDLQINLSLGLLGFRFASWNFGGGLFQRGEEWSRPRKGDKYECRGFPGGSVYIQFSHSGVSDSL